MTHDEAKKEMEQRTEDCKKKMKDYSDYHLTEIGFQLTQQFAELDMEIKLVKILFSGADSKQKAELENRADMIKLGMTEIESLLQFIKDTVEGRNPELKAIGDLLAKLLKEGKSFEEASQEVKRVYPPDEYRKKKMAKKEGEIKLEELGIKGEAKMEKGMLQYFSLN